MKSIASQVRLAEEDLPAFIHITPATGYDLYMRRIRAGVAAQASTQTQEGMVSAAVETHSPAWANASTQAPDDIGAPCATLAKADPGARALLADQGQRVPALLRHVAPAMHAVLARNAASWAAQHLHSSLSKSNTGLHCLPPDSLPAGWSYPFNPSITVERVQAAPGAMAVQCRGASGWCVSSTTSAWKLCSGQVLAPGLAKALSAQHRTVTAVALAPHTCMLAVAMGPAQTSSGAEPAPSAGHGGSLPSLAKAGARQQLLLECLHRLSVVLLLPTDVSSADNARLLVAASGETIQACTFVGPHDEVCLAGTSSSCIFAWQHGTSTQSPLVHTLREMRCVLPAWTSAVLGVQSVPAELGGRLSAAGAGHHQDGIVALHAGTPMLPSKFTLQALAPLEAAQPEPAAGESKEPSTSQHSDAAQAEPAADVSSIAAVLQQQVDALLAGSAEPVAAAMSADMGRASLAFRSTDTAGNVATWQGSLQARTYLHMSLGASAPAAPELAAGEGTVLAAAASMHSPSTVAAASTDGCIYVSGPKFASPRRWSLPAGTAATALAWCPWAEGWLMAGYTDGTLALWHTSSSSPHAVWPSCTRALSAAQCTELLARQLHPSMPAWVRSAAPFARGGTASPVAGVQWSASRPCVMFVLDSAGQLAGWDWSKSTVQPMAVDRVCAGDAQLAVALSVAGSPDHGLSLPVLAARTTEGAAFAGLSAGWALPVQGELALLRQKLHVMA